MPLEGEAPTLLERPLVRLAQAPRGGVRLPERAADLGEVGVVGVGDVERLVPLAARAEEVGEPARDFPQPEPLPQRLRQKRQEAPVVEEELLELEDLDLVEGFLRRVGEGGGGV